MEEHKGCFRPRPRTVYCLLLSASAVESLGALRWTQAALHRAGSLTPPLGALAVSFGVGMGNNLVNNLPLGLLTGSTLEAAHAQAW